jgi:hypothetical protein
MIVAIHVQNPYLLAGKEIPYRNNKRITPLKAHSRNPDWGREVFKKKGVGGYPGNPSLNARG